MPVYLPGLLNRVRVMDKCGFKSHHRFHLTNKEKDDIMKRRNFLGIALASLLTIGCASTNPTILYYAESEKEVESMKKRLEVRGEKVVDVKLDKISHFYIIKAKK